jgi:hypothetical protein
MLCQLVCIDRRYQRMNCFNIREVQTLLRSKYHPSFIDILEHHNLLEHTALGLRFKLFGFDTTQGNISIIFDYPLSKSSTDRHNFFVWGDNSQDHQIDWISPWIWDKIFYIIDTLPIYNLLNPTDNYNGVNWIAFNYFMLDKI